MANDLGKQTNRRIEATEAEIEAFALRYEKFLAKNLRVILKRLKDGKVDAVEASKILGGLQSELEKLGLKDRFKEVERIYAKELKQVASDLGEASGESVVYSDTDIEVAEALVNSKLNKIQNETTRMIYSVEDAVLSSVVAGQSFDVDDIIDTFGTRAAANVQTEVNTGINAFNRTVESSKAEELGLDLAVYLGPLDKVTRPFCEKIVNKVFTRDQILKMDNGQGLDVLTYGGGYNCRHRWRFISEEIAREEFGWGSK